MEPASSDVVQETTVAASLRMQDVSIEFPTPNGPFLAVDTASLEVPANGFTTIIGPSGCGKSTLLRAIADIIPISNGSITVLGQSPSAARQARKIGFVFQDAALLPWRTALQNVELPSEVGPGARKRAVQNGAGADPRSLLELVGLAGREDAYPRQLSGGMRQRVSIARALASAPELLLMDEPFGALDEITRDRLNGELLKVWKETNVAVVFVTHSIPEAVFLSQQVVVMDANPGRVRAVVPIELDQPRDGGLRESAEFSRLAAQLRSMLEG